MSEDENPVVPEESITNEETEDRLEGTIGSGDIESDFSESEETAPVEETEREQPVEQEQKEEPKEDNNKEGEEEMEEETPAPILGGAKPEAPASPATEAPAADAAAPVQKKKSHKGLIITLIIVALVLIGGGVGFAIWAMIHESPEVALRDAFSNIWKEENIKINGSLAIDNNGTDFTVDIEGAKSGKNIAGSGTIQAEYAGKDLKIKYSASYIDKGNLYVKLDGLDDLMDSLDLSNMMGGSSSTGGVDYSSLLTTIVGNLVEKIDGNWYKITADNLNTYSSDAGCILENLGGLFEKDSMDAIAESYKNHEFIEIDKDAKVEEADGAKYYTIKINKEKGIDFIKDAKADSLNGLRKCMDVDNAKTSGSEDGNMTTVKVGITPWSHKLVGIKAKGEKDASLDWKIKYEKTDISEPSESKGIDSIMEDIQEAVSSAMTSFIKQTCETMYGSYGDVYVQACVEAATENMGEGFDISSLLSQFGMGLNQGGIEDCTDSEDLDC